NSVPGIPRSYQTRYATAATPIRLASWYEARLIIAEADLAAGDIAGAVGIINFFRTRGSQPAFSSTDPDTIKTEIIDQRRRELFVEGQNLGDVIRYGISLHPPAGSLYRGGGTYGSQLGLP